MDKLKVLGGALASLMLALVFFPGVVSYAATTAPELVNSNVIVAADGSVTLNASSSNAAKIAISRTESFTGIPWQTFDGGKFLAMNQTSETLYVKFMTSSGTISETVVFYSKFKSLLEGDIVKTLDNPDVYIIKYKGGKQYKRLILSPSVFKSYGHLRWENIKIITQSQLDSYLTANLVQVAGDTNIYVLTPLGDTGKRVLLDQATAYDADSVYEINSTDRNSYRMDGESDPSAPMSTSAKVVFLHHSTGGVIWNGGVSTRISQYNASHNTSYSVTATDFPKASPYGWNNYPYDYWNIWVNHAGNVAYLQEPTLEMLTQTYDVIVFKHCYPVSSIGADSGAASVSSSAKTLQNYKLQYDALKAKMHEFPDKRFIIWTGAALVQGATNADQATRAKQFADWVRTEWDEPGDNIFVWDFFNLETGGGIYLLPANAASASDSHPNSAFAAAAAPQFAQRIIDVIEGRG